jgi:hypothetical protein
MGHGRRGHHYAAVILPPPCTPLSYFEWGWPYGPWEEGPPSCGGHPPASPHAAVMPRMGVAIWAMGGGASVMRRSSSRLLPLVSFSAATCCYASCQRVRHCFIAVCQLRLCSVVSALHSGGVCLLAIPLCSEAFSSATWACWRLTWPLSLQLRARHTFNFILLLNFLLQFFTSNCL